jgi:protein-tyrosine phosphatase
VVATPHFYPDQHTISDFIRTVDSAAEKLRDMEDRPRICLGSEVLYCIGLDEMEGLDRLCVRGTRTLLLELPLTSDWDMDLYYTVIRLAKTYDLVLAHVDRYLNIQPEGIDVFLSMGISAQVNASALFSASTYKKLLPYIKDGSVYALGSDLHMADKKLCASFAKAEKKLGEEYSHIMERAGKLLEGAERI